MTSEVSQMDLVLDTLFHWNIPGQPQAVARVQMHSLSSVWSLLILSEVPQTPLDALTTGVAVALQTLIVDLKLGPSQVICIVHLPILLNRRCEDEFYWVCFSTNPKNHQLQEPHWFPLLSGELQDFIDGNPQPMLRIQQSAKLR
jgi:hypothetical protein